MYKRQLLNSPYGPEQVWGKLPREAQESILAKKLKFYVVDALAVSSSVTTRCTPATCS